MCVPVYLLSLSLSLYLSTYLSIYLIYPIVIIIIRHQFIWCSSQVYNAVKFGVNLLEVESCLQYFLSV